MLLSSRHKDKDKPQDVELAIVYEGSAISIDKAKKAGWHHYEFEENDYVLEKYFAISGQHLEGMLLP